MSPLALVVALWWMDEMGPSWFDLPVWAWVLLPMAPMLLPAAGLLHLVGVRIDVEGLV